MTDAERARTARAEERRARWTGGLARSFAELEEVDLDFWLRATPAERVRAVTGLIAEMAWIGGVHGPVPRLQRSVGGVRPRRS